MEAERESRVGRRKGTEREEGNPKEETEAKEKGGKYSKSPTFESTFVSPVCSVNKQPGNLRHCGCIVLYCNRYVILSTQIMPKSKQKNTENIFNLTAQCLGWHTGAGIE